MDWVINLIIDNIKFRVKIKDLEELFLVIDMDMGYQTGELLEISVKGRQLEHGEHCFSAPDDLYGCYCYDVKYIEHLMMSYGRKDVNGVEIFEGDFVKERKMKDEYVIDGYVDDDYDREYIWMVVRDLDSNRLSFTCVTEPGVRKIINPINLEIVGNRWENPELLSKERQRDILEYYSDDIYDIKEEN